MTIKYVRKDKYEKLQAKLAEAEKLNGHKDDSYKALKEDWHGVIKGQEFLQAKLDKAEKDSEQALQLQEALYEQTLKAKTEEIERLKKWLSDALPNIECTNQIQSGLIIEIGEYLANTH